jgi:hypothetical protein
VAWLSVYERIERMQEKDPDKISVGGFSLNLKSGVNIPLGGFPPADPKVRIMSSPDDE